jgi:hypothetical protein
MISSRDFFCPLCSIEYIYYDSFKREKQEDALSSYLVCDYS